MVNLHKLLEDLMRKIQLALNRSVTISHDPI
jgi:hypothetical protein